MRQFPETSVAIENVRDPDERTASVWMTIFAVPVWIALAVYSVISLGLLPLFGLVISRLGQLLVYAHIKSHAVRVSPRQLPALNALADNFAQRLGIPRPEVYVLQDSMWNAFATRLVGRDMIVLLSGAVDSLVRGGKEEELGFLLGHEFGHIAAGHFTFWHRLKQMGGWFLWVGLWHRRRMELTADRVGLALCGDAELALRGLTNMTVGSSMAAHVDIDEAIAQWQEVRTEFFVRYRMVYSLYPSHLWRLQACREAAQSFGLPRNVALAAVPSFEVESRAVLAAS